MVAAWREPRKGKPQDALLGWVGLVHFEAVGETEVDERQRSSVGVFPHQGSGREVADACIEHQVLMEDVFAGGVKLVADIVAAEATCRGSDGGCCGGGVVVCGGRDLQRLLLRGRRHVGWIGVGEGVGA